MKNLDRRDFIKKSTLTAAAISSTPILNSCVDNGPSKKNNSIYMGAFAASKLSTVRAAFIGVGHRGRGHLKFFSSLPNTEVVAISDLYEQNVIQMRQLVKEAAGENQHNTIAEYWGDKNKWRVMLEQTKPDVVFIATNWKNHAPMAIGAMESGAHTFVEVPLAVTIDDLWKIVDTSERAPRNIV